MKNFLIKNKWFAMIFMAFLMPEFLFAVEGEKITSGNLKEAIWGFFYIGEAAGKTTVTGTEPRQVYIILAQIVVGLIGAFKIITTLFSSSEGKIKWSEMAIPGMMVIMALPIGLKLLVGTIIFGLIDTFI